VRLFFWGIAIMKDENTQKSEVLSCRIKGELASVIQRCVEVGNFKNKSQMLRAVFSKHVEKSNLMSGYHLCIFYYI